MATDFEVIENPIPEVIEKWRKEKGYLPNGIGYNIIFKCMTCGNNKQKNS